MNDLQEGEAKKQKTVTVKVCLSPKACGKKGAKYVWERVCNENGISDYSLDFFEKGGIRYEKTACQGLCEKGPNIKVEEDGNNAAENSFLYMNPIKTGKLVKRLQSGIPVKDIKRI